MRIAEACEAFLRCCAMERQLSPHSLAAYSQDLAEFSHKYGRFKVCQIERLHLVDYVVGLRDRGLAPATVKRRLACARGMFKWLKGRSHIAVNPFHDLDLQVRLPDRLPRCLDAGEMARLTQAARSDTLPTRLATFLLFVTGIRVSELARLTVADIDFGLGAIRINGKGNRQRTVFVTDHYTADLLHLRLAETKSVLLSEPLLRNHRRRPLTAPAIRARIKALAKTAGIGRVVTPHMLRHTTATCLLEAGVDIRFVQRLLGHQSITTTQIYTHVRDEALRSVLRAADIVSHISRQAC